MRSKPLWNGLMIGLMLGGTLLFMAIAYGI
jgi:hypothetical protein